MTLKLTDFTKTTVFADIDLATMKTLEQICISGLPEIISPELKDAIEILVNRAINPHRPLPFYTKSKM